jgi:hypothetical protein
MTTQTRTFIQLSDILSLRIECGKCGSAVTIPIARNMNFKSLGVCRNCSEPWLTFAMSTIESAVEDCARTIQTTSQVLENWKNTVGVHGNAGFSLSLEIRADDDHIA